MRIPLLLLMAAPAWLGSLALAGQAAHVALAKNLKVRTGHPTIFVDSDLVRRIRSKKSDCARFAAMVKKFRMRKTSDPSDTDTIR